MSAASRRDDPPRPRGAAPASFVAATRAARPPSRQDGPGSPASARRPPGDIIVDGATRDLVGTIDAHSVHVGVFASLRPPGLHLVRLELTSGPRLFVMTLLPGQARQVAAILLEAARQVEAAIAKAPPVGAAKGDGS